MGKRGYQVTVIAMREFNNAVAGWRRRKERGARVGAEVGGGEGGVGVGEGKAQLFGRGKKTKTKRTRIGAAPGRQCQEQHVGAEIETVIDKTETGTAALGYLMWPMGSHRDIFGAQKQGGEHDNRQHQYATKKRPTEKKAGIENAR